MHRPKLTVIIPVYNERGTILEILNRVKALAVDKEVIVVDNCSTDGTRELLQQMADGEWRMAKDGQQIAEGGVVKFLLQPRNFLKGTSVKTGIALAQGEYVVVQDADLEYDPKDIVKLLNHAQQTGAVAVFGSRLLNPNPSQRSSSLFQWGRHFLSWLFRLLYRSSVTDVATCYKLMKTEIARSLNLKCKGFDLDFEIAAKLRRRGHQILELPISYRPRSFKEGKKLRLRDAFKAVWVMVKCRFFD